MAGNRRSGSSAAEAHGKMATVLSDEIDVLAKAKRDIAGGYVPTEDEPYMGEPQLDYYRQLLMAWKRSILDASAAMLLSTMSARAVAVE